VEGAAVAVNALEIPKSQTWRGGGGRWGVRVKKIKKMMAEFGKEKTNLVFECETCVRTA
jgi:hypothetical protein